MELIDTHAHLYSKEFDADRSAMIQRAKSAGLSRIYLPNVDAESIEAMLELENQYPGFCFPMMGLHPCSVDRDYKKVLDLHFEQLQKRPFVAIGEIGLDYYWSKEFVTEQQDAFRIQSQWALDLQIPIIIHARESLDDLIQIVSEIKAENNHFSGIFHCFSGNARQAQSIIDLGFYIGIGGVLTYKKSNLGEEIKNLPLESIVLETDAPYLSPVPHRGKRNESAYIYHVAEHLSQLKGISIEEVAGITTQNALRIFGK